MLNNILFIAVGLLLMAVVAFSIGFVLLMIKFKEVKEEYEFFRHMMAENNKTVETVRQNEQIIADEVKVMRELTYRYANQYENVLKGYSTITDCYNHMVETHRKLLECWKDIDEKFEASTEQFRNVADQLVEFKNVLEPIKYVLEASSVVKVDAETEQELLKITEEQKPKRTRKKKTEEEKPVNDEAVATYLKSLEQDNLPRW